MNDILFYLLRCVVNAQPLDRILMSGITPKDWGVLFDVAQKQGVSAVVFDHVQTLPKEVAPPKEILVKWYSQTMYIERQLKKRFALSADFAAKMAEHEIPVVVLKGLAFAVNYPNPLSRECGDLDCYMMGKAKEGDGIVKVIGGTMEDGGYKHAHLYYEGLTIENHYFLTDFDKTPRGIYTERYLQRLIGGEQRKLKETHLLSPCADFNALFLIKHAQRHFIEEGINLRHLLDWAFFLKKEQDNVNWDQLLPEMEKCWLLRMAQVLTELCVEKFGVEVTVDALRIPAADKKGHQLVIQVMDDIMGGHPDIFKENFLQKCFRILRRFVRMWRFRDLADETYLTLVWNTFAFSSYLNRKVELEAMGR